MEKESIVHTMESLGCKLAHGPSHVAAAACPKVEILSQFAWTMGKQQANKHVSFQEFINELFPNYTVRHVHSSLDEYRRQSYLAIC